MMGISDSGTTAARIGLVVLTVAALSLGACASGGGGGDTHAAAQAQEKVMAPPARHPLAKIEKGMSQAQVRKIMGDPDNERSYLTGKMFIPFYFGSDARRNEWVYNGKGRVAFSSGAYAINWKVFRVEYDPSAGS